MFTLFGVSAVVVNVGVVVVNVLLGVLLSLLLGVFLDVHLGVLLDVLLSVLLDVLLERVTLWFVEVEGEDAL